VIPSLGTGVYSEGLQSYSARSGHSEKQCVVCGDVRHDMDHCYSATADGFLSLPSLAFLDESMSDAKIKSAQSPGCSLYNQPPAVIETVRSIVNRLRKNFTTDDRERNIQNKRDSRKKKEQDRKSGIRPTFQQVKLSKPLVIDGATAPLKITEDYASIKSLRDITIEEAEEKRNSLLEEIARLNEALEDKEREVQHEGSGGIMYIKHNMIHSINGVDTSEIADELLEENQTNNSSLVFLNFSVRGIQPSDGTLRDIEKNQKTWLHDTSQNIHNNEKRKEFAIQMDNGGARTVASRAFADHCKAPVLPLKRTVKLMAFNKSITPVTHYAVFVIAVKGIAFNGLEGIAQQTREFRVTALITDTEQPLILGSEVITQQNIVFNPQMRRALFFQGEPHAMIVDMVPWDEIKDKLVTSTIIRSIKLSEESEMETKSKVLQHFKITNTPLELECIERIPATPHRFDNIADLITTIQDKPKEVLKDIKTPYKRWMILALIIFGIYMQNLAINFYTTRLRPTIYKFEQHKWYSNAVVDVRANFDVSISNIRMSKKLITHELTQLPPLITHHMMNEIKVIADTISQEQQKELAETNTAINNILSSHCKELMPEKRPPEFPEHLWKYVFDNEKDNAIPRTYRNNAVSSHRRISAN
jgi:hypothetical protein